MSEPAADGPSYDDLLAVIEGLYITIDWMADGVGGLVASADELAAWNEAAWKAERILARFKMRRRRLGR